VVEEVLAPRTTFTHDTLIKDVIDLFNKRGRNIDDAVKKQLEDGRHSIHAHSYDYLLMNKASRDKTFHTMYYKNSTDATSVSSASRCGDLMAAFRYVLTACAARSEAAPYGSNSMYQADDITTLQVIKDGVLQLCKDLHDEMGREVTSSAIESIDWEYRYNYVSGVRARFLHNGDLNNNQGILSNLARYRQIIDNLDPPHPTHPLVLTIRALLSAYEFMCTCFINRLSAVRDEDKPTASTFPSLSINKLTGRIRMGA
jgi:hypothetical protein